MPRKSRRTSFSPLMIRCKFHFKIGSIRSKVSWYHFLRSTFYDSREKTRRTAKLFPNKNFQVCCVRCEVVEVRIMVEVEVNFHFTSSLTAFNGPLIKTISDSPSHSSSFWRTKRDQSGLLWLLVFLQILSRKKRNVFFCRYQWVRAIIIVTHKSRKPVAKLTQ